MSDKHCCYIYIMNKFQEGVACLDEVVGEVNGSPYCAKHLPDAKAAYERSKDD